MSKVSFRARALDATKPMPVFKAFEIPDIKDFAQINRSVPQMPTGMEKEEEMETHLQRALSAQQAFGTSESLAIPIPEVQDLSERYTQLYKDDFRLPKQYIHIQAFNMDQEIPDYDLDSDDESWLNEQSKKMDITALKFEEMMDRLEKGSGQQVVSVQEAKLLLKEDDDLIIAVYDYWLNKRLNTARPLMATVKSEKRDGTTTNNPYVAFRRRTEKMQTRKNRKNDEVSYEKMLKLRRDLQKALTLLEFLKRREKSKKELLQLTMEIIERRNEMEDFSGAALAAAEEERDKHPTFVAPFALNSRGEWVPTYKGDEPAPVRKKRQYKKRKQSQQQQQTNQIIPQAAVLSFQQHSHSSGDVDIMDSSEDEILSPAMSQSDHEDENDPDGMFAFKRRKDCNYLQSIPTGMGNWPWYGQEDGGRADRRFCYSLTSLPHSCIGYSRRRIGRGGRVIFDRVGTAWDDALERLDFTSPSHSSIHSEYVTYIRENKISHYRPKTPQPTDDKDSPPPGSGDYKGNGFSGHRKSDSSSDFDVESFHCHREQLLEMQREQQQKLLTADDNSTSVMLDLERTYTPSELGSRFTLDSAGAEFAVRALVKSPSVKQCAALEATTAGSLSSTASSPIGSRTSLQHVALTVSAKNNNGKTINNSISSLSKISSADTSVSSKLPVIACSVLSSSSISLLHNSSSTSVLSHLSSSSASPVVTASPGYTSQSSLQISSNNPVKTNGPLSSHVKSSGLSNSHAADILQLNSSVTPSTTALSSTTISTLSVAPVGHSLQLQRSIGNKLSTGQSVYKLPVSTASTNSFDILRNNHEESTPVIIFNKDTGIPMDVT